MPKNEIRIYTKSSLGTWTYPNYWDAIALCMVFALLALLALGAKGMASPYHLGEPIVISLDPLYLPYYAFRSVLRMGMALICALLFTLVVGTAAAKSKKAQRVLIPLIDILQSVPVLGYLSITVVAFIALFPNSIFGPECAAIFVIFTAQVWNMTLSFYQSLRTIPHDLQEAVHVFHLSGWQRFWKLEVPFAMPGLLWNAMMSMSGSWFFVVASEAITVNQQNITLPGIGSYIALAVTKADMHAVVYAIIAMFVVILIYDQILFRPLNDWAQKFKFEETAGEELHSAWIVQVFRRTTWLRHSGNLFFALWHYFVNFPALIRRYRAAVSNNSSDHYLFVGSRKKYIVQDRPENMLLWSIFLSLLLLVSLLITGHFVFSSVSFQEGRHVLFLGLVTAFRVMLLILISSFVWVPIGVFIGLRPKMYKTAQPIIQFLASFPVNLFYPIVVLVIVKYGLNANIWTSPLMILGAQWYLAFNVIAGVSVLSQDLHQTARLFNLRGRLWWKRFILPGIFPYYVTGAITASGGAWNASIVAEVVSWGPTTIKATGLGAYITSQATAGDFPRLALGIGVMCMYVLAINRLLWRPLYELAATRFRVE
jgi:NitT/TauT family transport system permease protein